MAGGVTGQDGTVISSFGQLLARLTMLVYIE